MIKNIEAAKQLIDKYQDFIDNQRLNYEPKDIPSYKILRQHTGFGDTSTCSLCSILKVTHVEFPKAIEECKECVWSTVYQGSYKDSFCGNENYSSLTDYNIEPEEFYELLKERIELLKEAIEASEQLNKEEENE